MASLKVNIYYHSDIPVKVGENSLETERELSVYCDILLLSYIWRAWGGTSVPQHELGSFLMNRKLSFSF